MNTDFMASFFNLAGPDGILVVLIFLLVGFPIWMVVDCVNHEFSNDKLIWLLIILVAPLGSLIYFFARKVQRPPVPPGQNNFPPSLPR